MLAIQCDRQMFLIYMTARFLGFKWCAGHESVCKLIHYRPIVAGYALVFFLIWKSAESGDVFVRVGDPMLLLEEAVWDVPHRGRRRGRETIVLA